jgi:hypothetical protein
MPVVQIPDFLKEVGYLVFTNHLGLLYKQAMNSWEKVDLEYWVSNG